MSNTAMQITKLTKVNVPVEHQENGVVAFQIIEISYEFYGKKMTDRFDTKILNDGRQYIIEGNGFIKTGKEI